MAIAIDVQYACDASELPGQSDFAAWAAATLTLEHDEAEMTIRVVNDAEGRQLNEQFRQRVGPTNVLAFPFELADDLPIPLLGDVIICAPVARSEAASQDKSERAHFAHLTVHGTLHLMGYDHQDDEQSREMEAVEIEVLDGLGFANPYAEQGPTG